MDPFKLAAFKFVHNFHGGRMEKEVNSMIILLALRACSAAGRKYSLDDLPVKSCTVQYPAGQLTLIQFLTLPD